MEDGLKEVVRDNVTRLLGMQPKQRGLLTALMNKGFGNGTAQAILSASREMQIDMLQRLAKAFEVEPWPALRGLFCVCSSK